MFVQTRVARKVSFVLCLSMLALQNGCSNSGSGQAEAPASNTSAINLALSTTSGVTAVVADGRSTIPIRLQVTTGSGAGRAGVPVTFATTAGALSEAPAVRSANSALFSGDSAGATRADSNGRVTVTTDANGVAQVLLTASTTAGTAVVTADAMGFRTHIDIVFVPGPAARVQLNASPNTVSPSGTSTLTAIVTDVNSNLVVGETVTFTLVTNTSGASLSATSGITNSTGQVTVMYTAGTTAGADTVRALATSTSVGESTSITVTASSGGSGSQPPVAGPVNGLLLRSISNPTIGVRGSGTNETSNLIFEARDSNGNLASGATVSFTLDGGGLGGGEDLTPLRAPTVNGQVTTTLKSGTKAGTVKVLAFIDANGNSFPDATEIASQAISVVITGGPPWGENLSVAVLPLNIAGLVTFGLADTITTFLSDRFSNPVPDGTAVSFFSNFAGITGAAVSASSGGTTAATATATLTSQGPVPPDGFVTVTPATLSGSEARVLSLAVNPANANLVYAGTDGGGVFRTTNGLNTDAAQVSWTQVGRAQTGLTNGIIRDIQIDPTNTSILYVATDTGVFRSTGGGDTWTPRSGQERITGEVLGTIGDPQPFTLAFPSNGDRARTIVRVNGVPTLLYLYVGTQAIQLLPSAGVFTGDTVSIDYDLGSIISASRITALALDPTPLSTDPATTRTLYAGTQGGGVFRTRNGGFSWEAINNGISDLNILSLVALSPDTLYAGTFGGGVFRTFNATATIPIWSQVNNGLTSTVINTLATDRTRVYAGTFLSGVFFLTDGTPTGVANCPPLTLPPPCWTHPIPNVNTVDILNGFVSDIIIDPNNPAILYAATLGDGTQNIEGNAAEGGVFRSTDSGATWTRMPALPATQLTLPPTDLPNNRALALGISAANSTTVYVGTAGRNVVRFTPSTGTFIVTNGTPPNQITNSIFVSGTVLFSGNTRITLTEISDVFQDQNRAFPPGGFGPLPDSDIFNGGSQAFIYTVSDLNGNPITGNSTVTVAATAGVVSGNTNVTIPDTQRGSTVFGVTWQNNRTAAGNIGATLTVSASSAPNGNVATSVSRVFIGPLTVTPTTGTLPLTGGSFGFAVSGGSETLVSQGGGYSISATGGGAIVSSATIDGPGNFTLTLPAGTSGTTATVTVRDRITGQQVTATVTLQ